MEYQLPPPSRVNGSGDQQQGPVLAFEVEAACDEHAETETQETRPTYTTATQQVVGGVVTCQNVCIDAGIEYASSAQAASTATQEGDAGLAGEAPGVVIEAGVEHASNAHDTSAITQEEEVAQADAALDVDIAAENSTVQSEADQAHDTQQPDSDSVVTVVRSGAAEVNAESEPGTAVTSNTNIHGFRTTSKKATTQDNNFNHHADNPQEVGGAYATTTTERTAVDPAEGSSTSPRWTRTVYARVTPQQSNRFVPLWGNQRHVNESWCPGDAEDDSIGPNFTPNTVSPVSPLSSVYGSIYSTPGTKYTPSLAERRRMSAVPNGEHHKDIHELDGHCNVSRPLPAQKRIFTLSQLIDPDNIPTGGHVRSPSGHDLDREEYRARKDRGRSMRERREAVLAGVRARSMTNLAEQTGTTNGLGIASNPDDEILPVNAQANIERYRGKSRHESRSTAGSSLEESRRSKGKGRATSSRADSSHRDRQSRNKLQPKKRPGTTDKRTKKELKEDDKRMKEAMRESKKLERERERWARERQKTEEARKKAKQNALKKLYKHEVPWYQRILCF